MCAPLAPLGSKRMLRGGGSMASNVDDADKLAPWQIAVEGSFWAIFGEVDTEFFDAYVPYGQPVLFLYTVVASIVLVNLLVAMFSDTYNKVYSNSEIEYKFQKYSRIFLYMNVVHRIPPPFNVAVVGPQVLVHYITSMCTGPHRHASASSTATFPIEAATCSAVSPCSFAAMSYELLSITASVWSP